MNNLRLAKNSTNEHLEDVYNDPYIIQAIKHDERDLFPLNNPLVAYYSAFLDETFLGCIMFIKFSPWEIELHSLLKRNALKYSRDLGVLILKECFSNQMIERVTTTIPHTLNTVKNYALKLGFKEEGIKRNACFKQGKLNNIHIYGLLRKDFK